MVLVSGFDWAYDLTPLREAPIAAENIGYTTHPYANKRPQPWEPKWEEDFGFAAADYPVIATEFGGAAADQPNGTQPAYGPSIIKYLESKGIGWVVWCFDPEWGPTLIRDWQYTLVHAFLDEMFPRNERMNSDKIKTNSGCGRSTIIQLLLLLP